MESKNINLSIIVPVYNTEIQLLERCLKSICQIKQPIEILIVDDGSKKFIGEFVGKCCKVDNRIKYIYKENGGVSSARNVGIELATGKYIMFVDSDDELTPEIDSILRGALNCSEDWIILNFEYIGGKEKSSHYSPFNQERELTSEDILGLLVPKNRLCESWAKLIRKKVVSDNGICFPENYDQGEDVMFNLKLISACKNYRYIDKTAYLYYIDFGRQDVRRLTYFSENRDRNLLYARIISEFISSRADTKSRDYFNNKLGESQILSLGGNMVALYRYKEMTVTNKNICKAWRNEIYRNYPHKILKLENHRAIVYEVFLKCHFWLGFRILGILRRMISKLE